MTTEKTEVLINRANPKKVTKKKSSKARPSKVEGTKKVNKKANKPPKGSSTRKSETGFTREKDLPWCDKKVAVFKALKSFKAVNAMSARSTKDIAAKVLKEFPTGRGVRHYCYHAAAANLIARVEIPGQRGYGFHLTAKGQKIDPVAELKKLKSEKTAKKAKTPKAKK